MRKIIKVFVLVMFFSLMLHAHDNKNVAAMNENEPVVEFMNRIAKIETPDGNHRAVNRFGMLGRYQFSPRSIRFLGYNVTRQQFLNDRELQDTVMLAMMRYHNEQLETYITKYDGKIVKGIKMNRATILAGAHFAGAGGVQRFLTNPNNRNGTVDANGTSLKKYMSRFVDLYLPPELLAL